MGNTLQNLSLSDVFNTSKEVECEGGSMSNNTDCIDTAVFLNPKWMEKMSTLSVYEWKRWTPWCLSWCWSVYEWKRWAQWAQFFIHKQISISGAHFYHSFGVMTLSLNLQNQWIGMCTLLNIMLLLRSENIRQTFILECSVPTSTEHGMKTQIPHSRNWSPPQHCLGMTTTNTVNNIVQNQCIKLKSTWCACYFTCINCTEQKYKNATISLILLSYSS